MQNRALRILLLIALISGLAAFAAPSASAAPPFDVTNFLPDDDEPTDFSGQALSDKFDGFDQRAHLTTVATADADRAAWFVCPSGTTAGQNVQDVTQAELASCSQIGEDTEGVRPVGGNPFLPTDEAYELFWDIPGSLDLQTRDIVVLACIGAGNDIEGADANCNYDAEEDVVLEDAQTGDASTQTSTAEIVSYCTADVAGGPGAGATDPCEEGGVGAGTNAEVAARFKPLPHGSNIPNNGFVARVTTDPSVTDGGGGGLRTHLIPGDGQTDPDQAAAVSTVFCNEVTASPFANHREYECIYEDADVPDQGEFAFAVYDFGFPDLNAGLCSTSDGTQNPAPSAGNPESIGADFQRCRLDAHYVVSGARQATTPSASFVTTGPGGPTPAAGTCAPANTDETNVIAGTLGGTDTETVRFCITDQFGDPFIGQVTFESTGPEGSGFIAGGGCVLHDHDADGRNEHCHVGTATDGTAVATIDNFTDAFQTATPGDQVVLACIDPQSPGAAPPAAPPANHGCADEATLRASVTKHWVVRPSIIQLVFNEPGTDPQDQCLTGDKFKENVVGDQDELLVCTFDANGNFVGTEPAGNGRLQWFIAPSGGGELTGTRFVGSPPNETGADGTNTTLLEAFRAGNDVITVCGQNDPGQTNWPGGAAACDAIQKRVTQGTTPPPPPGQGPCANIGAILGTEGNDVLVGTNGDDIICGLGGDDVIDGEGGDDILLGNAGNDTIRGGNGRDSIRGGTGDDAGTGGRGKDVLRGGAGNDSLKGNKFHDTLRGGAGNDELRGGRGRDTMNGGAGNDVCVDRFGDNIFRNCETVRR